MQPSKSNEVRRFVNPLRDPSNGSEAYQSDAFDEAQAAKQSLAVAAALCSAAGRSAAEALGHVRVIDPDLPGFLPFGGD